MPTSKANRHGYKNYPTLYPDSLRCSGVEAIVGHSGITYWDEGFHAVVARNLTKHPLKFTLYDQPWLPYDYKGWGEKPHLAA